MPFQIFDLKTQAYRELDESDTMIPPEPWQPPQQYSEKEAGIILKEFPKGVSTTRMPLKHVSAGSVQTGGKYEKGPKSTKGATAELTNEHPPEFAADFVPAALGTIPPELWEIFLMNSTWAADRTIMLRMTSKRVREAVDKIRPPAVVCLSRSFWGGQSAIRLLFVVRKLIFRKGTAAEKLKFVLSKLALMTVWCRITRLELRSCDMKGRDAERLAEVLAKCPALVHLELGGNLIRDEGAGRLAGVLGQCAALAHLNLSFNQITELKHNIGLTKVNYLELGHARACPSSDLNSGLRRLTLSCEP